MKYGAVRKFFRKPRQMSLSTLKRRIESYSLKRKRPDYNIDSYSSSGQETQAYS